MSAPLLSGAFRERARRVALRLAEEALAPPREELLGHCGPSLVLLCGHLESAGFGRGVAGRAQEIHHRTLRWLPRVPPSARHESLYTGLLGLAWACATTPGMEPRAGELHARLSKRFVPPRRSADLLMGLPGLCAVFSAQPSEARVPALDYLCGRLDGAARRSLGGVRWQSRFERPGVTSLGLAHGQAGVIAGLSWTSTRLADPRPRRLYRKAMRYLAEALARSPRRSEAWCNGLLGIAASVHAAATALKDEAGRRRALGWAGALARAEAPVLPPNAVTLCHGTAGAAHLFHRLFRESGDAALARAARARFQLAVARLEASPRAAPALVQTGGIPLLYGGCGVALALLSATGDVPLAWDRALMVGPP